MITALKLILEPVQSYFGVCSGYWIMSSTTWPR